MADSRTSSVVPARVPLRQWLRQRLCQHRSTTGVDDAEFTFVECDDCGLVSLRWTRTHEQVLADYEAMRKS